MFANTLQLGTIKVSSEKQSENPQVSKYSSSTTYEKKNLDALPTKNRTLDSVLRQNTNVTFSAQEGHSTNSGEITLQNFSINGASFYQNNFMVDGANFTNDIDPAGYPNLYHNIWRGPSLDSQADFWAVLLMPKQEIQNMDFMVSHRSRTQIVLGIKALLTSKSKDKYKGSRGWLNRSNFKKWRSRIGFEGMVNENFGLIVDYTRHTSNIKSTTKPSIFNDKFCSFPGEKE